MNSFTPDIIEAKMEKINAEFIELSNLAEEKRKEIAGIEQKLAELRGAYQQFSILLNELDLVENSDEKTQTTE